MGNVSHSEDIQQRREDAQFCEHEPAPDIKELLVAPVEPRRFDRRSAPAPKLKKSKQLIAAEKKYRRLQQAKVEEARRDLIKAERDALGYACDCNRDLRALAEEQAKWIGPSAPFHSLLEQIGKLNPRGRDARSIADITSENEALKALLEVQAKLIQVARAQRARRPR